VKEQSPNHTDNPEQSNPEQSPSLSRRQFALGVAAGLCLPWSASRGGKMGSTKIVYPDRTLPLNNVHTGETENITYWSDGHYIESGLSRVNWMLRDFRTGDIKAIDPRLLNVLYVLTKRVDTEDSVLILSGYRSKKTNDMLRQTTEGVARRSFHMAGRAVDIRIPRIASADLQKVALRLGGGGVGYYPNSNFVHLDTGPVRTW